MECLVRIFEKEIVKERNGRLYINQYDETSKHKDHEAGELSESILFFLRKNTLKKNETTLNFEINGNGVKKNEELHVIGLGLFKVFPDMFFFLIPKKKTELEKLLKG